MYNSKQFLAPGGLNAECVQVSVMLTWGLDLGSWIWGPKAWEAKLISEF